MLTLSIKKKWYDMILSGKKKEEYREIKPYYISRFRKILYVPAFFLDNIVLKGLKDCEKYPFKVLFRNGYGRNVPAFIAECTLSVGTGKEEWGAEKGKQYFVLTIHKILEIKYGWIKIQGYEYKDQLPKKDCMIWITRVFCTGERWVQKVEYYAGEDIDWDGTLAWMPDCEKEPEPYMGNDVRVIQSVRS